MRLSAAPAFLLVSACCAQSNFPDYIVDQHRHLVVASGEVPLHDVDIHELPDSVVSNAQEIDRQLLFEGKQYLNERARNRWKVSALLEQYKGGKDYSREEEQRQYAYLDSLELVYPEFTYDQFDLLTDQNMRFIADLPDSASFWAQPLVPWAAKPSHWYSFFIYTGGLLHGESYVWSIRFHVDEAGRIGEWQEMKKTNRAPDGVKRL